MNKEEFLNELRKKLSGLPQEDIEERISFYGEMIDDRVEDGFSEEEAISEIGTVDQVVEQIMSETPLVKLVKEKVRPKRKLKTWEIVLLILGSPVWVPLCIAAIAVAFSAYIVIWAGVVCVYAVDFSFAACAFSGMVDIFVCLQAGNPAGAIFSLGVGLLSAGLAILMFFASVKITRAVIKLTGKMLTGMKASLLGKGAKDDEQE